MKTAKQEVELYARQQGMRVCGKGGIPMLSKGGWVDCFDTWQQAQEFLAKARNAKIDHGKTYPWD